MTLLFSQRAPSLIGGSALGMKQYDHVEIKNGSNCILKYGKLSSLPLIGPHINRYFPDASPETFSFFAGIISPAEDAKLYSEPLNVPNLGKV